MYILNMILKRGDMSKLTPHEHFSVVYNAKVELITTDELKIKPFLGFHEKDEEKTISIKMSESSYNNFLHNHMRIVELMEGVVHDQRIRDQFEKLMILINLTK